MLPNIFMRILMSIIFISANVLAQENVKIKHMSNSINSTGAEFNFILNKDKDGAFFTAIRNEEGKYFSSIYHAECHLNEWSKGIYFDDFNSDFLQSGNIFITKENVAFFTLCEADVCSIYSSKLKKGKWSAPKRLDNRINLDGSTNTQPNIAIIEGEEYLLFTSNRPGGYGGLDIWISTINSTGRFGNPINLGAKINSEYNEITPFYKNDEGKLFFSSDRQDGYGGYDIYKSKGAITLWEESIILKEPFNSKHDEMYFNFNNNNNGHFSSNRAPSIHLNGNNCCVDIFSFEIIDEDTINNKVAVINELLPLALYFHNDEPDCCTFDTSTEITYEESYISYFMLMEDYIRLSPTKNIENFFTNKLRTNFTRLENFLREIKKYLESGNEIELQIKGFSSPLFTSNYNINLSKRRITSLINYMNEFYNGGITQFLKNNQLIIKELPLGESISSQKVSDNPKDLKLSVYSLEAVMERKIEIIKVKAKE